VSNSAILALVQDLVVILESFSQIVGSQNADSSSLSQAFFTETPDVGNGNGENAGTSVRSSRDSTRVGSG